MGGRKGPSCIWVAALTSFLLASPPWAQEEIPPGKRALFDASDKAKTVPLEEGVRLYEQVIARFPGTVYAGQAIRRKLVTLAHGLNQPQAALDSFPCTESNGNPDQCVKLLSCPERQFVDSAEPCFDQQEATCTLKGLSRACGESGERPEVDGGCRPGACSEKLDTRNGNDCSTTLQGLDAGATPAPLRHPCPHWRWPNPKGGAPWAGKPSCHVAV